MVRLALATGFVLFAIAGVGAQPLNDHCADAIVIAAVPFTSAVDTTAATTEAGDPTFECDGGGYGQETRSVWYRYTSATGGPLEIDTFGSDYDTVLTVWRGTCEALGDLASCNDGDYDASYFGDQSRLVVTLAAHETINIEVVSGDPTGGNLVLHVQKSSAFQVTDEVVYRAQRPDVVAASDGTFLVVWEDRGGHVIMGRRYCDTGIPIGSSFAISEPGDPTGPQVVRSGVGGFVVVWIDDASLQGRRLSASGAPLGPQFEVSADVPDYYNFGLAGDPSGRFVVTWERYGADGDGQGIVARRFDAATAPLGAPFVVNASTTGLQMNPDVTADAAGNFVVTWQNDAGTYPARIEVLGQRYDSSGAAAGSEFQVNVTTTFDQAYPAVAARPNGDFVVVWHDQSSRSCGQYCVVGRRYDAAGGPQGGEFVVSDGPSGSPAYYVSIDVDASSSGAFAVAWADENDFPWARAFDAGGAPVAAAFQVGLVENDYQRNVRMAMADDGDFVVVWDWAPQGSHYKIMARAVSQNPSCPALARCPPAPRVGCKQPALASKGALTLVDRKATTRDTAIWSWVKGEATTMGEIGDALAADSYTFCLYDGANALMADVTVPPGGTCGSRPCWSAPGSRGFEYTDRKRDHGVVRRLMLKSGGAGQSKVVVKTQGDGLAISSLPPALPIRAQLASTTGVCWEAEFRADGVIKSTPSHFRAKPSR